MRWYLSLFALPVSVLLYAQTPPVEPPDWSYEESVLRGMNLPTKGSDLLRILRDRTPKEDTVAQFKKHASRLDAANFAERMKANADLLKMGSVIRPLLEQLIAEGRLELETKRRVEQILETFPPEKDIAAVSAASRLIDRDKPAERLPVLLDFIPHATNEAVRQDVQRAIDGSALEGKKPAALILEALKDSTPARRAAAGEALVRTLGPAEAKVHIEPLLADAHPLVRYQVGKALVEKHDKAGLPMLIASINTDVPERVEYVMDLLQRAAGESAPNDYYQGKQNADKVAGVWKKWHEDNQAKLDLSKLLNQTTLGYTVITMMALKVNAKSKIVEIGPRPQNAVRWEFESPRYPVDVEILGPNRLLIAEYQDRRVTERDFKGNILKEFPAPTFPIACQRLPNGQTFIATRQQLQILDSEGKQVFSWQPQPNPFITAAYRQKNGHIAVITSGGVCQLIDAQGKELKKFNIGAAVSIIGTNIEVLPNGRVLVPLYTQNQIAEFDWNGQKVWQAQANRPLSVTRLANGNTLVTHSLDYRVVELDRNGKEVWSYRAEGRPFRARRR